MPSAELELARQEAVAAYWKRQHRWLASKGYHLRTPFRASWTPAAAAYAMDPQYLERGVVVDAVRVSDGKFVALKRVQNITAGEVDLAHYFQSIEGKSARNHCVPILDVLPVDGEEKDVLLVMPLLKSFDEPPFTTFGEVVAFLSQIFEGLEFLHDTVSISHGECVAQHIMMDAEPLYPHSYDPSDPTVRRDWSGVSGPCSRTSKPVRYYFVDFGHSTPFVGRTDVDKVNRLRAADVYDLGDTIRQAFFNKYDGFEFLYSILADMMQLDHTKRPSASALFRRFLEMRESLSDSKLRARLIHTDGEPVMKRLGNDIRHWFTTTRRSLIGIPAIPDA